MDRQFQINLSQWMFSEVDRVLHSSMAFILSIGNDLILLDLVKVWWDESLWHHFEGLTIDFKNWVMVRELWKICSRLRILNRAPLQISIFFGAKGIYQDIYIAACWNLWAGTLYDKWAPPYFVRSMMPTNGSKWDLHTSILPPHGRISSYLKLSL